MSRNHKLIAIYLNEMENLDDFDREFRKKRIIQWKMLRCTYFEISTQKQTLSVKKETWQTLWQLNDDRKHVLMCWKQILSVELSTHSRRAYSALTLATVHTSVSYNENVVSFQCLALCCCFFQNTNTHTHTFVYAWNRNWTTKQIQSENRIANHF